jgi:hypothetical protein
VGIVGHASSEALMVAASSGSLWQTALVAFGGAAVGAFTGVGGSFLVNRRERTQVHRGHLLTELVPILEDRLDEAYWAGQDPTVEFKTSSQPIDFSPAEAAFARARDEAILASKRDFQQLCNEVSLHLVTAVHVQTTLLDLVRFGRAWDDEEVVAQAKERNTEILFALMGAGALSHVAWRALWDA